MLNGLLWLNSFMAVAVLVRAWSLGIQRRFPLFLLLLLVSVPINLVLILAPRVYVRLWSFVEPALIVLRLMIAREAWKPLAEHYVSTDRKYHEGVLWIGTGVAAVLSLISMWPDLARHAVWQPLEIARNIGTFSRYTHTVIAVFLIVVAISYFAAFPVRPARRNDRLHLLLLAAQAITGAVFLSAAAMGVFGLLPMNILLSSYAALYVARVVLWNSAGEIVPPKPTASQGEIEAAKRALKALEDLDRKNWQT